jgi:hypothetical protein
MGEKRKQQAEDKDADWDCLGQAAFMQLLPVYRVSTSDSRNLNCGGRWIFPMLNSQDFNFLIEGSIVLT